MLYEYIKVFLEASPLLTFDDHMKAIDDTNNIVDKNRKARNLGSSQREDEEDSEYSVEEFKRLLNPIKYMPPGLAANAKRPRPKS